MSDKIKSEISKQKFVIAFVVVLIGVLWLSVFYLELEVKKETPKAFHLKLEKDLCVYLPKECRSNELKNEIHFYCQTGTTGKLIKSDKGALSKKSDQGPILQGEKFDYLLSIMPYEGKNKDLGSKVPCP